MRADRLIAELMLLQTHGKVSAAKLAEEMEVSQRTIYRDMLALNTAGIPVYAENGSNGGYQLVDGYRTQLTGFNSGELQALFAMNIPAILGELGMDAEGKAALRKLQASLSSQQNRESEFMAQRFLYDPTPRTMRSGESIHRGNLEKLQKAIWNDRLVEIEVQFWYQPAKVQMKIAPYALVLKENRWYLVYYRKGTFRVLSLGEIVEVTTQDSTYLRDKDFDLSNFWEEWSAIQQAQTRNYVVELLLRTTARPAFNAMLEKHIQSMHEEQDGWQSVVCAFQSLEEARGSLLQWGGAVRILAPEPLRLSMTDHAEQFLKVNPS